MGSSTNGVTRGQLRPYIGSRGPPFIICGLFVFLVIVGYSYWNLSFRFNILYKDFISLEEKLRTSSNRNEVLLGQNEALNKQVQRDVAEIEKTKSLVVKKDEELLQLSTQLRSKEDEIGRISSQIEELKPQVDKYKQDLEELKIVKDQMDVEIKELKEKNSVQQQIINNARIGNKQQTEEHQIPVKKQPDSKTSLHSPSVRKENRLNEERDGKENKESEQKPEAPLDPNVDVPNDIV